MRHGVVNNKFRMKTAHRIATFSNMAKSLIEKGKIETTVDKAKYLRTFVEPLITLGKRGDLSARRLALKRLHHSDTVDRLFDVIAHTFKDRKGGYTRVLKLGHRRGDNAAMAVIEFTDQIIEIQKPVREPREAKAPKEPKTPAVSKAKKAKPAEKKVAEEV